MPITERSTKEPLLKNVQRIGHGTLGCIDLQRTRRWYEEVLGFQVIQTSPISIMVKKGTDQVYAVVEVGPKKEEMEPLNHNGLDVLSREEVDAAYKLLTSIKEEWGIREIRKPTITHGDYCFYFCDLDGNWWEIVFNRPEGNMKDFLEPERDLTGHHEFAKEFGVHAHTHDPDFRARLKEKLKSQN